MKTSCSECGQEYPIREEMIGKRTKCKKCGKPFAIHEMVEVELEEPVETPPAKKPDTPPARSAKTSAETEHQLAVGGLVMFILLIVGIIGWTAHSHEDKPSKKPTASVAEAAKPQQEPKKPPKPQKVVYNSPWNGSVYQVKDYLEEHLKDPDSFDAIEWSGVNEVSDGYIVRLKYRARNSLGGMIISNQIFNMDKTGKVISVTNYD